LLRSLPAGQIVITTAGTIPPAAVPDRVLRIAGGAVVQSSEPDGLGAVHGCERVSASERAASNGLRGRRRQ
jgi:hypothetical protein